MDRVTVTSTPIDSDNDADEAGQQLLDIGARVRAGLKPYGDRWYRKNERMRTATFVLVVTDAQEFCRALAASPYARFYTVKDVRYGED